MFEKKLYTQFIIPAFLVLLLFRPSSLSAQIYVTPSGAGSMNGSSWSNAWPGTQLQNLISTSASGSQIWVKAGMYKPTAMPAGSTYGTAPRSYAFTLKNGVAVYGGFAGTETLLSQRNVTVNVTILSGDIGTVNNISDNCYHVVLSPANNSTAILDGFSISDGNANGASSAVISFNGGAISASSDNGAGLYCLTGASPTITNCTFSNNNASYNGGGLFQYGSSANLVNCVFNFNKAANGAGAYYQSCPAALITNCNFSNNRSSSAGGGIHCYSSSPSISGCTFYKDTAQTYGGGIYNLLSASPTISNSSFSYNECVGGGGGLYNGITCNPSVTNTDFSYNHASNGGAMENYSGCLPVISNCNFLYNSSAVGGGMYNEFNSNVQCSGCSFRNNTATDTYTGGGAMANFSSSPVLTDCFFSANIATGSNAKGGSVYNYTSSPVAQRCIFSGNATTGSYANGGGVYNETGSAAQFLNCIFFQNSSAGYGGGMYNNSSAPTLANCTFYANAATTGGGGLYNYSASNATLTNIIIWGNTGGGTQVINNSGATPNVTYSDIQGSLYPGTGNINADPLFVNSSNPAGADNTWATVDDGLMLQCMSPAADAGITSAFVPADIITTSRPKGIAYDMGAYEQTNARSFMADSIQHPQTICTSSAVQLTVAGGFLGANANWKWYTGSCNAVLIDSGISIIVSLVAPTTYYVNATGSCNTTACVSITLTPDSCVVLPVTFTDFRLNVLNRSVKLSWTVTDPDAIDQFEIERSPDGKNFGKIGFVQNRNALNAEVSFAYTDDISSAAGTTIFYRLKVINNNDNYYYSKILPAHKQTGDNKLILPNPVTINTPVTIIVPSSTDAEIRIVDMAGRKLFCKRLFLSKGQNIFSLKCIERLSEGSYIFQVLINQELISKKIIISDRN
jgi:hypothetical protein